MSDTANLRAIVFVLIGVVCISINDMLIKGLSGGYPLHQIVLIRASVGLLVSMVFLRIEGGWSLLRTDQPVLHGIRALLIVMANLTFFAALAIMPLGAATVLFFVAPLFITLLAVPVLGERLGRYRMAGIAVGLCGVGVMMAPGVDWGEIDRWSLALPVLAAGFYAGMQVLTRRLGVRSTASAMTIYIQLAFILTSLAVFLVAGDGRYADRFAHEAVVFLLRAWVWPASGDLWVFLGLGVLSGLIGYALSQAYRLGTASVVASYEYVALPLAIFWGWLIFGEVPALAMWIGTGLIALGGLYVFARERQRSRDLASASPVRRS